MEVEIDTGLSIEEINNLDEKRINALNDAGINEMEVLDMARRNINIWQNYFTENITRGKDDANFCFRDQWTAIERSEFTRLFKPALTFNKIYDPVKKIVSEQRNNKPDLMARSLTGHASEEELELRSDMLRTICYKNQNDLIYQGAFKDALTLGFGAIHVTIDYETPQSFNQVINFSNILDPTQAAFDPAALKPHKGDGNWCSRNYIFAKEEFAATYPYIMNPVSFSDPRNLLDFQWEMKDSIVVCDYYIKEWYSVMVLKLSNGMSVTEEEWENMQSTIKIQKDIAKDSEVIGDLILNEIPHVVRKRQSQDYRIMHYRLLQDQIIDFSEWPGKELPIVFVDGDSVFIEGRQYTRSFIHEAKDAQKSLNYLGSEIVADIKNRRREQWIGTPDNILGNEQIWRNPELQNGILLSKPDPKTGQLPQKTTPWDMSPALMTNYQRLTQDVREILGFSETESLQGRDMSGKARRERKLEGAASAGVYYSNLNQAIEQCGRVVMSLLPAVYGGDQRIITLSKPNGKNEPFILNQKMPDGSIKNEILPGDYDVEIDTGPSFAIQKDIALEFLQETLQAFPQSFPLIADLYAKNLDVQFMPQMVERFQTLVPPEILAKENGQPPPPPQPNPEQQMQQQQMQMAQQQMAMNQQKMQIEAAQLKEREQELQIRQEKHELEKLELAIKMQELQEKLHAEKIGHGIELHKANLDYDKSMAKIIADLHIKKSSTGNNSSRSE